MKRIVVALALLSLTGCAQMVELDQKIARSMNPHPVVYAQDVGKARQGLTAEPGGLLAYYHTSDRKPTQDEIEYARKANASFDEMVQEDKARVRQEIKIDPRVQARTNCDIVFEALKAEAVKRLVAGDYTLYDNLAQKGDKLYNECYDEQLAKAQK